MKKTRKMMFVILASIMILLLAGCGGSGSGGGSSADSGSSSADVEVQTPDTEVKKPENNVQVDVSVDQAIEGILYITTSNLGIVINDTPVPAPYYYDDLTAAGVPDADYLREVELGAGDFYTLNMFLDENEDYVVIPSYYNDSDETVPVTEATADEIMFTTYADTPEDQNVAIFGIKFGMTKAEVKELLGEPTWDEGDYCEWLIIVEDAELEGNFTVRFTSDGDDAPVSEACLSVY